MLALGLVVLLMLALGVDLEEEEQEEARGPVSNHSQVGAGRALAILPTHTQVCEMPTADQASPALQKRRAEDKHVASPSTSSRSERELVLRSRNVSCNEPER